MEVYRESEFLTPGVPLPPILTKVINTFATSFYGSSLWDIFSPECEKLYTSWNVTVRQVFNLNRKTHRYLIEPLSQCFHAKIMIYSRFVTFQKSLLNSSKLNVRFLAKLNVNDQRTLLGRTLQKMRNLAECGIDELSASYVKRNIKYFETPMAETWRIRMLQELLMTREGKMSIESLKPCEIDQLLNELCTT